jgi:hypothetical protein
MAAACFSRDFQAGSEVRGAVFGDAGVKRGFLLN